MPKPDLRNITIHTGPPGPEIVPEVWEEVIRLARQAVRPGAALAEHGSAVLYLVPTRRMARRLRMRALERDDVPGFVGEPFLTFNDFVGQVFARLEPTRTPISEPTKAIVLEEILSGVHSGHRGRSALLRPGGEVFPGLVQAVAGAIKQFKDCMITPLQYRRRLAGLRSEKHDELGAAWDAYDRFLREHSLADTEDMFLRVARATNAELATHALRGVDLLVLDRFYDLTPVQARIVDRLTRHVQRTHVVMDYEDGRDNIYGPSRQILDLFGARATIRQKPRPSEEPFCTVSSQVFAVPGAEPRRVAASGRIQVLEARDPAREVEAIAAEIKRALLAGPPLSHRDICVTFASEDTYAPLIREVFPRYGIDFNFSYGFHLDQSPVAAAIFAMVDVVLGDYRRDAVLGFLASPYVTFRQEKGTGTFFAEQPKATSSKRSLSPFPSLDVAVLDRESRRAGVIDGRAGWDRRLADRRGRLQDELARIQAGDFDPDDVPDPDARARDLGRQIAELDEAALGVHEALGRLAVLEHEQTVPEFKATLLRLIDEFEIERNIPRLDWRHIPLVEIEKASNAVALFRGLLDQMEFADRLAGRGAMPLAELAALLRAAVASVQYQVRTYDDAGVQVMGLRETRGLRFHTVFVAGMVTGQFPQPPAENAFLLAESARALGLRGPDQQMSEQRCHFLRLLGSASQRLVFSWPLAHRDEPTIRSPFLDELLDVLTDGAEVRPRRDIFSRDALNRWIGARLTARADDDAPNVAALVASGSDEAGTPGRLAAAARRVLHNVGVQHVRRAGARTTVHEGVLASPRVRRGLAREFGPAHKFSVAQFEQYARCPFAFLAKYCLDLAPLEVPEEFISPLTRGQLLHDALCRFYVARPKEPRVRPTPGDAARAAEDLKRLIRQAFKGLSRNDLFWEKELETIVRPGGLADAFVENEVSHEALCEPRHFEFAFGKSPRTASPGAHDGRAARAPAPPLSLKGDVLVVGRIDRVDVSEDGKAVVADYKTGAASANLDAILRGISCQLPVYLRAAESLLGLTPAAGEYYVLAAAHDCGRTTALGDAALREQGYYRPGGRTSGSDLPSHKYENDLASLLAEVENRIAEWAAGIRAGVFPVTRLEPSDAGCSHCDFRRICRIGEWGVGE